jgi:hypothetical protein
MNNFFDDAREAMLQAKRLQTITNEHAKTMAFMLSNRLQSADVAHNHLVALKKELERYNMHTRSWK